MPHTKRSVKKTRKQRAQKSEISGQDLSILAVLAQHPNISPSRKKFAFKVLSNKSKAIAKQLDGSESDPQPKRAESKARHAAIQLKEWAESS